MRCAIYARVSTKKQETDLQLTDLRKYAVRMEWESVDYLEKASSVKYRPVFEEILRKAKAGKIDVLLVWRIDRFARSMRDFVNITLQLKEWRVRLISATENVDSGDDNPFAKFMIGLLALLAELERNIIVERVRAGVAEAQRQGRSSAPNCALFSGGPLWLIRRRAGSVGGPVYAAFPTTLFGPLPKKGRNLAQKSAPVGGWWRGAGPSSDVRRGPYCTGRVLACSTLPSAVSQIRNSHAPFADLTE